MHSKVTETLAGLKDFQAKTVDYVFNRMYNEGQDKMLIADEVGLGKTIVAKGFIAKGYQRFIDGSSSKKQFRVVYICSNQALSGQNIRKLNFFGDDKLLEHNINRLTYLSLQPVRKEQGDFKISALTPGTSFDTKRSYGEADERAIIFALLINYAAFEKKWDGLKALLKGNKGNSWENLIFKYYYNNEHPIRKDLFQKFKNEVTGYNLTREKEPQLFDYFGKKENISLWNALLKICDDLSTNNNNFKYGRALVSTLRRLLSKVCVQYLEADVFILDEFQRYNQLIKWEQEEQPPAVEMAKAVFSLPNAKIIMLSATPFKAYTNDFDEINGEIHYSEFKSVLQFLIQGKDDLFWNDYELTRKTFHKLILNSESWQANNQKIQDAKKKLEEIYISAMVRTERLLVSHDGNALIRDILKNEPLSIAVEDIQDFINVDAVSKKLNEISGSRLPIPIEYVKSTPYALSFLEGYQLKKRLSEEIGTNHILKQIIKKNRDLFISRSSIENYRPVISQKASRLPNAKLRKALEKDEDGWKLLWVPPTLPYYELQGVFKNCKHFSKTLIFSSWVMVPKMIATVMSYEAERKSIGSLLANNKMEVEERANYFDKPRSPKQQFTFKTVNKEDAKQLSNFTLLYPSITLSELYNPETNLLQKRTYTQLKNEVFKKVKKMLDTLNIRQFATGSGDMDKWLWAAPILIDKLNPINNAIIKDWFTSISDEHISIDTEGSEMDKSEHAGRKIHFETIKSFFFEKNVSLPPLTKEKYTILIDHLVEITLSGPATCLYRTLSKYLENKPKIADSAYCIALSFLSLFNKPESIAIIRLSISKKTYWQQVLEYCIDGNFQAMLDEFVYLLYDCEGLRKINDFQNYITDILTLKTSTIDIDSRSTFTENSKKMSIRTHYAMDFGTQKKSMTHGTNREVNLRQTFNSPFRPFVLATTSIGQEGLDFHLYCKKIIHWNLPSNPIDFEQREGRINRYKGLVIRQNVAEEYKNKLGDNIFNQKTWDVLFDLAKENRKNAKVPCDLIPFWHIEPVDGFHSQIERYVPLYPFSKDIEKYKNIQHILTYYRLTFGQPRQDDLMKTFNKNLDKEDFEDLMINLCPLLFNVK